MLWATWSVWELLRTIICMYEGAGVPHLHLPSSGRPPSSYSVIFGSLILHSLTSLSYFIILCKCIFFTQLSYLTKLVSTELRLHCDDFRNIPAFYKGWKISVIVRGTLMNNISHLFSTLTSTKLTLNLSRKFCPKMILTLLQNDRAILRVENYGIKTSKHRIIKSWIQLKFLNLLTNSNFVRPTLTTGGGGGGIDFL